MKDYYPWPEGTLETALKPVKRAVRFASEWLSEAAYIAGNEFSLADIFYYQLLTWARKYDVTLDERMDKYLTVLQQRSSFPDELRN